MSSSKEFAAASRRNGIFAKYQPPSVVSASPERDYQQPLVASKLPGIDYQQPSIGSAENNYQRPSVAPAERNNSPALVTSTSPENPFHHSNPYNRSPSFNPTEDGATVSSEFDVKRACRPPTRWQTNPKPKHISRSYSRASIMSSTGSAHGTVSSTDTADSFDPENDEALMSTPQMKDDTSGSRRPIKSTRWATNSGGALPTFDLRNVDFAAFRRRFPDYADTDSSDSTMETGRAGRPSERENAQPSTRTSRIRSTNMERAESHSEKQNIQPMNQTSRTRSMNLERAESSSKKENIQSNNQALKTQSMDMERAGTPSDKENVPPMTQAPKIQPIVGRAESPANVLPKIRNPKLHSRQTLREIQAQAAPPIQFSDTHQIPDMSYISGILPGRSKNGAPVFTQNGHVYSHASQAGRSASISTSKFEPSNGIPVSRDEKDIYLLAQRLQDEVIELHNERATHITQITELRSTLTTMQSDIGKARDKAALAQRLQDEVVELRNERTTHITRITELSSSLSAMQSEIDKTRDRMEELKNERITMKSDTDKTRNEAILDKKRFEVELQRLEQKFQDFARTRTAQTVKETMVRTERTYEQNDTVQTINTMQSNDESNMTSAYILPDIPAEQTAESTGEFTGLLSEVTAELTREVSANLPIITLSAKARSVIDPLLNPESKNSRKQNKVSSANHKAVHTKKRNPQHQDTENTNARHNNTDKHKSYHQNTEYNNAQYNTTEQHNNVDRHKTQSYNDHHSENHHTTKRTVQIKKPVRVSERISLPNPYEDEHTLRPSVDPSMALAGLIQDHGHDLEDLKRQLSDKIQDYQTRDFSMGKRARKAAQLEMKKLMDVIDKKADELYGLYDVLEGIH
ncbi:hypothetical protein B7494_g485 [Chlorociboria aeruginascens]|nr:hypothetical protein B7494_g485 [Chlorociboria aeruginascens]